jgi:hypothetical protein
MELINIRFFKLKGGLAAQQDSGTKFECLLPVTSVLTTTCLKVHWDTGSGKKRNYAMNEQYRGSFLRSSWLN